MYRKSIVLLLIGFTYASLLLAQNPISPPGVYIADPAAQVWKDGRLYVYGSVDESCNWWCSHRYHMLSTGDMLNWTLHENTFSSSGENDQVPYNNALLYAPDCMEKEGIYYLYYCQPGEETEGIAVSDKPTGPFMDGRKMNIGEHKQIDPGIFTDDDGQVYYLWGQFSLKMAKMNPGMLAMDESTIREDIITEKEHFFHEGAFMTKRNGIYYLVYADISRSDMPTCIGYATATSPFGPYTYRGVIVDNDNCNPNNWNNHGSIAEFNNQWYVFYHRSSHGCTTMRKACVEPIEFSEDGSIDEVEMTTQGAAPPLPATSELDAARACLLQGSVRITLEDEDNEILTGVQNGDKVFYKYLNFEGGIDSLYIRVKPGTKGGSINLFLNQPWHHNLASLNIESSITNKWKVYKVKVDSKPGIYALGMVFYSEGKDLFEIDWLRFE